LKNSDCAIQVSTGDKVVIEAIDLKNKIESLELLMNDANQFKKVHRENLLFFMPLNLLKEQVSKNFFHN
jgi:hypothetical protein